MHMIMKIKGSMLALVLLISLVFFTPFSIMAQTSGLSGTDLSQIKVDDLTDEQIQKILDKATASGLTEQQLEAAALAKGMPQTEIDKLKQRISSLNTLGANKGKAIQNARTRTNVSPTMEKGFLNALVPPIDSSLLKVIDPRTKIFGYSLFTRKA